MEDAMVTDMHRQGGDSVDALSVRYDGEAMRTHEMDVRQLAPALLSLDRVFEILQQDVAPDAQVRLNVKATREGSFDISLNLILQLANEAQGLLNAGGVTAILNAAGLMDIFFRVVSLLKNIVRHVKPAKAKDAGKDGNGQDFVDFMSRDGSRTTEVRVPVQVVRDHPEVIREIQKVLAPLQERGVDRIQFRSGDREETVTAEDARAICRYDPLGDGWTETVEEMDIRILDASLRRNGK